MQRRSKDARVAHRVPRGTGGAHRATRHRVRFDDAFPLIVTGLTMSVDSSQVPNYHDYLEFTLVEQGRGVFHAGQRSYRVKPGDTIVITEDEFHYMETDPDESLTVSNVFFLPSIVAGEGALDVDKQYLDPFLRRPRTFSNRVDGESPVGLLVRSAIEEMKAEARSGHTDQQLALKTLLLNALMALSRHCGTGGCVSGARSAGRHDGVRKLEPVFAYIARHFAEKLTGAALAREASLSAAYFSRLFHSLTGTTVTSYVCRYRVDRAKQLLREGRLSTAQVAFAVGFESESYFYRAFRSVTRMTPQAYRERVAG